MGFFTQRALGAVALMAIILCVAAFDPMSVDNNTKLTWCQNQVGFCTNVCQEMTKGAETQQNQCDIQSLLYVCICEGNISPNASEYTYTIPYFQCVADNQACIKVCPQSDNACYSKCNEHNCAAAFPKKYNQTIATSLSPTPTGTNGLPVGTGLPPSFGSGGSSPLFHHTWASVGGSSVLGLVVFLTAGVMFGGN
ncbi:hypothetical protein BG004_003862 [Podila humilis]|nr:hypothetical protein BG004_003862 [Podila humilis]